MILFLFISLSNFQAFLLCGYVYVYACVFGNLLQPKPMSSFNNTAISFYLHLLYPTESFHPNFFPPSSWMENLKVKIRCYNTIPRLITHHFLLYLNTIFKILLSLLLVLFSRPSGTILILSVFSRLSH